MLEVEAKYLLKNLGQVDEVTRLLTATGMQVCELAYVDIDDCYLDTPGWEVLDAGWALRRRETASTRQLCLKAVTSASSPTSPLHRRQEIEQIVASFSQGRRLPRGPILDALPAIDVLQLHELFRIRTRRRRLWVTTPEGTQIEVAVDEASVHGASPKRGSSLCSFLELELELKSGDEGPLCRLAASIENTLGLLPSRLSKFERGLRHVGKLPPRTMHPASSHFESAPYLAEQRKDPLHIKDSVEHLIYRHLVERFEDVLIEQPRAWEGLDSEGVHQMRVAIRRIRATLRSFEKWLPTVSSQPYRREWKWVAATLGDVRDLDVQKLQASAYQAMLPAADSQALKAYETALGDQWKRSRHELLTCFKSPRYSRLQSDFSDFLVAGPASRRRHCPPPNRIGHVAKQTLGHGYKRLLQAGRLINSESEDAALHALRIRCKRFRYLAEAFTPIYGKALRPTVRSVKDLQEVLGDFQDACVGIQRVRQAAALLPMTEANRGTLLGLGQLMQFHRSRAIHGRQRFDAAWGDFDRAGRRKSMLLSMK